MGGRSKLRIGIADLDALPKVEPPPKKPLFPKYKYYNFICECGHPLTKSLPVDGKVHAFEKTCSNCGARRAHNIVAN